LEEDSFGRGLNNGFGAIFDLKLFSQPGGDDDLTLGGEPDGICL
jgi:hypothetical protein